MNKKKKNVNKRKAVLIIIVKGFFKPGDKAGYYLRFQIVFLKGLENDSPPYKELSNRDKIF